MSDSPRVMVVAPLYHTDRGGLGRQAVLLTERLATLGVRPLVVTRYMEGLPPREFAPGVEVVRVRAGRADVHNYEAASPVNLLTSLRFSAGLVGVMERRRRDYDLVHFHGASLPLVLALPAARLRGKAVLAKVAALHQGVEAGDLRGRYGPLGRALAAWLGAVDGYVATTAEIGAALRGEGYREAQVQRIPNFVDVERFRAPTAAERDALRRELGLAGRTVVLHSGRLTARKGAPVLLDAFARAAGAGSGPLLLFLGDGPERAAIEARARALGLGDRVRFEGFREDVWRYLAAADVLVLPSFVEGMPNALLEAMATGLPAVATRLGGALEAVIEGESGLLVPPGDADALARALEALLGDPGLRRRLGEAAAARIRERFTLDAIAPRYVELYRRMIAARR